MANAVMNNYEFTVKDIDFSLFTYLKNNLIALKNRKRVFKEFCAKCGINLPIESGRKYRMPTEYLIDSSRIAHIFSMRDRIILALYSDYQKKQQFISAELAGLEEKINSQNDYLDGEKKKLEKYKKELTRNSDPAGEIDLQAKIDYITVRIAQQSNELSSLKEAKSYYLAMGADNRKKWARQVSRVEEAIRSLIKSFLVKLTKKIVDGLGFTDFSYKDFDYSDEIKEKIKGE